MKKILFTLLLVPFCVFADAKEDLTQKILTHTMFKANFYQVVLDENKKEIATSQGYICIDRQNNKFLSKTSEPDVQIITLEKDGVYYYDEFLNQLTIYSQKNFDDSPIALIKNGKKDFLDKYNVVEKDGAFIVDNNSKDDIKSFLMKFNKNNSLTKIVLCMSDGSTNAYNFSSIVHDVKDSDFIYEMPKDVEVIDAR